jgi:hypothetical protein
VGSLLASIGTQSSRHEKKWADVEGGERGRGMGGEEQERERGGEERDGCAISGGVHAAGKVPLMALESSSSSAPRPRSSVSTYPLSNAHTHTPKDCRGGKRGEVSQGGALSLLSSLSSSSAASPSSPSSSTTSAARKSAIAKVALPHPPAPLPPSLSLSLRT